MGYIAFDLDAIALVPKVARSANVPEGVIAWGLVQLWEWGWREKTDAVTDVHLRGFFGAQVSDELAAFGFLERRGDTFRIRGAERYLRLSAARSKGGHAAKGNLIPGARQKKAAQLAAETQASITPDHSSAAAENLLGSVSALTATSEQPLKASVAAATAENRPRADATWKPLLESMERDYLELRAEKWEFVAGRDATALSALRANGRTPDEIRERWRAGLAAEGFQRVSNIGQLRTKWGDIEPVNRTASREAPRCKSPDQLLSELQSRTAR